MIVADRDEIARWLLPNGLSTNPSISSEYLSAEVALAPPPPVQGLRTAPYPPRLRDRPHRFVELVRNLQSDLKTAEPKGPVGCQLLQIEQ